MWGTGWGVGQWAELGPGAGAWGSHGQRWESQRQPVAELYTTSCAPPSLAEALGRGPPQRHMHCSLGVSLPVSTLTLFHSIPPIADSGGDVEDSAALSLQQSCYTVYWPTSNAFPILLTGVSRYLSVG